MERLNILSLFSGIGAFEKALDNIGVDYNLVNYCEIDKYASKAYSLIHNVPEDKNLRDVTTVDTSKLPPIDLVTYGFPCVPAGYLINTKDGYKPIESIISGDVVLTHTNTYQKVIKTMKRTSNHIYHIKGVGVNDLQLTDEHPVYTYRDNNFVWIKVKDLTVKDKLVYNINTKNIKQDITDDELYLMGRYVADGYKEKATSRILYAIGLTKINEFESHCKGISFNFRDRQGCREYKFFDSKLESLLADFDTGSLYKKIPQNILDLPKEQLEIFFNGYMSGDGHNRKDRNMKMFTTVNKYLGLQLQQIIMKLYSVVSTMSIKIDNRKETFNNSYNYQFCLNPKNQIVIEDKILVDIKEITREDKPIEVYNFEVANDNSYCVENIIVHNCQDISIAGKMRGFKDEKTGNSTRSGLFFEALRIIEDTKPKYAIAENVKNLTSKKFEKEFNIVLTSLEQAGYTNYWKVLNARDYGIPQNRERVFIISIRKDIDTFSFRFPKKQPLTLCLKDLLEDKVDEKYYYSGHKVDTLIYKLQEKYDINDREVADASIKNPKLKEVSNCITARYDAGIQNQESIGAVVVEPKLDVVGNFNEVTNYTFESNGRIYNEKGLAPTLSTAQGGGKVPKILAETSEIKVNQLGNLVHRDTFNNPQEGRVYDVNGAVNTLTTKESNSPKILVKVCTKKGYEEAKEYDSVNMSFISSNKKHSRVGKQEAHTLTTNAQMGMVTPSLRIRKLTPKECFRLMGFDDKDIDVLIDNGISNSQLYKMAGNSIVVDVLEAIFRSLLF